MRKAFTMVELLVVIGIIGVLSAVMLGTFSGGTDSAKTAQCLSNLRNLSAACQSVGVSSGIFPLPSSLERGELKSENGQYYIEYDDSGYAGWIAWNSKGAYPSRSSKRSASWRTSMYSEDRDAYLHSLTNGSLWKSLNGNESVYTCPVHGKKMKAKGHTPHWSYVMNAYFNGTSVSNGKRTNTPIGGTISRGENGWFGIHYGELRRADRRLLFAEIPFVDKDAKFKFSQEVTVETSGDKCDSVLQYEGYPGASSAECIGFNHKSGKRYCANVVFADGHTEKLLCPKDVSTQQLQELTRWLCEAKDVSFDGSKYEKMD